MADDYRVVLTKEAPDISLPRDGGEMRINLSWRTSQRMPIDLDLCCLWELADGSRGCVQALGGKYQVPPHAHRPVIRHDGDRQAGGGGGENIRIDMTQVHLIKRVLVFAHIYDGVPNWAAADAIATIHPVAGTPVEVVLDEADPFAHVCAIALLRNEGGKLTVHREVRYFARGHRAMDAAYGWGLNWRTGRKL